MGYPSYAPLPVTPMSNPTGPNLTEEQFTAISQATGLSSEQLAQLSPEQLIQLQVMVAQKSGGAAAQQNPLVSGATKIAEKKGGGLLEKLFSNGSADKGGYAVGGNALSTSGLAEAGQGTVFANGSTFAGTAVGTAADGGTLMSTGVTVPISEGASVASTAGTAGATGAFDLGGIGSAGNVFLPAAGAVGGYNLLTNNYGPGRGALQGAASGAAIGSYFGPEGALIGGGIGGAVGLTKGLFKHETTRQHAQKDTAALRSQFQDDPTYQAYVNAMRSQYDAPPPDPSHPFHNGQYSSWGEYKKAGLDAGDLSGVLGNLQLGSKYTNLSEDQKKAFTQAAINANLYDSKRGEVIFNDPNRAQQLFDSTAAGGFKIPVAPKTPAVIDITDTKKLPAKVISPSASLGVNIDPGFLAKTAPPAMMIPRKSTRSPGIDLQGNRINYGARR